MRIHAIFLLVLLLSACAPRPAVIPGSTAPGGNIATETRTPPGNKLDALIKRAVEDLSGRLSLNTGLIHVISTEAQLWPDSSLGCPQPGVVYTQQTVPGYRLRLEANGIDFFYHTDEVDTVILCEENDLPSFPVTPGEIDDGQPWMPVD